MSGTLTRKQTADRFQVHVGTVLRWEREGLLTPTEFVPNGDGPRRGPKPTSYRETDVDNLERIRELKRLNKKHFQDRSPLRYPGGKSRAVPHILPYIPMDPARTIMSPFVGGASLELALSHRGQNVVAYDAWFPLVAFWQCALTDAPSLAEKVYRRHRINPKRFRQLTDRIPTMLSIHEMAATFFILNRCAFSGLTLHRGIGDYKNSFTEASITKLRNLSAPNLWVAHGEFEETIPNHADDFIYADPPYWLAPEDSRLYGDKGELHASFNHEALAELLLARGDWVLSYNDCDEVREMYKGCEIDTASWGYAMNKDKKSSEVIIRPQGQPRYA